MKHEKLSQVIEEPAATLTLHDTTKINTSIGVMAGLGITIFLLTVAVVKNILNCYSQYAKMLVNVEKTATVMADLKTDQEVNFNQVKTEFSQVKSEFDRVNRAIHDVQISLNSSEHRIETMQKLVDLHTQKIELVEASINFLKGRLGPP